MFDRRKLRVWAALSGCVCAVVGFGAQSTEGASSTRSTVVSCADFDVIDIHGSGSAAGSVSLPGAQFAAALRRAKPQTDIELIPSPLKAEGGLNVLTGAVLKLPLAYHQSVVKAKKWLRRKLNDIGEKCPLTQVFLTGYSQGAQAAGDVYQERSWPQVLGVALFGDSYFNHRDSAARFGLNAPQKKLRTGLDGTLGARPFFSPAGRVLSYCHHHDPVCQGPLSYIELVRYRFSQHNNYARFGEPEAAVKYFVRPIMPGGKSKPTPKPQEKWPTKQNEGSTVFFMYLGANLILPNWSSCDPNYCIVGSGDTVYVFSLISGIDQIGAVPFEVGEPRAALTKLGIPTQDIDKLLAP